MPKDNRLNRRYDKEKKEALIKRMLPPESCPVSILAEETGISKSTLGTWKHKAKKRIHQTHDSNNKPISSKEKFLVVMETYTMTEIELSKYCRTKGYYVEEVKKWKNSCIGANSSENDTTKKLREEIQTEKKKNKNLAKDLRRKEKALAETAALLVLRKKLDAILGDQEEE